MRKTGASGHRVRLSVNEFRELEHFDAVPEFTGGPCLWREAEILRPGTYKGAEFSAEDVQSIAALYDRVNEPVPLQLEHSMSLEKQHGFVHAVKTVEMDGVPVAVALLQILGSWAIERVLDGRLAALSAGLYLDPCEIFELSFVRRGACPTARLLSEETIMDNEEEREDEMPATEETPVEDEEEKIEEQEDEDEQEPAEEAKLSAEASETERLKSLLEETTRKLAIAEVNSMAQALLSEGYTTAALRGDVEAFLLSCDESQRVGFVALMRSHARVWTPGRESKVKLSEPNPGDAQLARMRKHVGL